MVLPSHKYYVLRHSSKSAGRIGKSAAAVSITMHTYITAASDFDKRVDDHIRKEKLKGEKEKEEVTC